jgi:hypothetical protein
MEKLKTSKTLEPAVVLAEPPSAWPMTKVVDGQFADVVSMCVKCCRKLGADGKALRKQLKAAIHETYGPDVELEKRDCFSLCPKGGQVLSTSGKHQPRRIVIVEPGSHIGQAIDYLLK